jgi:hypothetical protein
MPYQPNVSDDTANAVAKYLLSVAYRPFETEDEDALTVTFDRKVFWESYGADSPVSRREDFYLALTMLAEDPAYAAATEDPDDEDEDDGPTRAFVVKGGGARRVHVVIAFNGDLHAHTFRNDADSDAWIDAGDYDSDVAREILEEQGFDLYTELPDAHRVIPKVRPQQQLLEHDLESPRRCSRCGETKPPYEFNRRGAEGTPGHPRFASRCQNCSKAAVYEHRALAVERAKERKRRRFAYLDDPTATAEEGAPRFDQGAPTPTSYQ